MKRAKTKIIRGYYGFPSKAAYQKHYSDPKLYAAEIPAMEAYAKEAEAERPKPPVELDLLTCAKNAAATLVAIYDWVDQIEQLGGATNMEGVARCHAMLQSLRRNGNRVETLVLAPLRAAIAKAEKNG